MSVPETAQRKTKLWHPFADMSRVDGNELTLERGQGVWVYDSDGRSYLDATAGLWYCNVGHGRERLAAAADRQMRALACYQTFDLVANRPALELAERLCQLAAMGDGAAAFFTNGGSDSVDTAAKLVRRYWRLQGEPERTVIVAREGAYHGMHAYGTSLAGISDNASGWGTLIPDVIHVARDDVDALERVFADNPGRIAALIAEPVQGAAGVYPPAEDYWPRVQQLCRRADVLLIADEVVTGFGRLGHWFAKERYGLEPDLLVGAKGLSSGYAPVGVVIASEPIVNAFWSPEAGSLRHGYTYSGHPTACAVALENLRILEEERLVDRVRELEKPWARQMATLEDHPLIKEARVAGLLCGLEFTEEAIGAGATDQVVTELRHRGVLTRALGGRTLQLSPPFVITEAEMAQLSERLGDAFEAVRIPAQASRVA